MEFLGITVTDTDQSYGTADAYHLDDTTLLLDPAPATDDTAPYTARFRRAMQECLTYKHNFTTIARSDHVAHTTVPDTGIVIAPHDDRPWPYTVLRDVGDQPLPAVKDIGDTAEAAYHRRLRPRFHKTLHEGYHLYKQHKISYPHEITIHDFRVKHTDDWWDTDLCLINPGSYIDTPVAADTADTRTATDVQLAANPHLPDTDTLEQFYNPQYWQDTDASTL